MTKNGVGMREPERIVPNKGRRLQVAPTRRKRFGKKAKAEFLEWFAATCNASLSARKVGFDYRTAFRHRREDPVFAEQWDEALRLGYVRLEELALRQANAALETRTEIEGDREMPEEMSRMDPTVALQLLREHRRGLAGIRKPGRAPTVASTEEVRSALVKRLKAFGIRVKAEREGRKGERR